VAGNTATVKLGQNLFQNYVTPSLSWNQFDVMFIWYY